MNNVIRVLQIGRGSESAAFGGVEKFLVDYYRNIDKKKFVFDFVFCGKNSFKGLEEDGLFGNSKITELSDLRDRNNSIKDYLRLRRDIIRILRNNSYDIVHINSGSIPVEIMCLSAARKMGIKAISHSHSTQPKVLNGGFKGLVKQVIDPVCRRYIVKKSHLQFACSIAAGKYLYGDRCTSLSTFHVIANAIDANLYRYNPEVRKRKREEYGISDTTCIYGFVGRLSKDKNISFIIKVFDELHKINHDSKLILVGDGEERDSLIEMAKARKIQNDVIFLGQRKDIPDLLQIMDCFLMPSLDEGLSIVLIEAQASGLQAFAFDSLSKEHQITPSLRFIPYKASEKEYAEHVLKEASIDKRKDTYEIIKEAGYEIGSAVKLLEEQYFNLTKMTK